MKLCGQGFEEAHWKAEDISSVEVTKPDTYLGFAKHFTTPKIPTLGRS
jgi:hypothetical protein